MTKQTWAIYDPIKRKVLGFQAPSTILWLSHDSPWVRTNTSREAAEQDAMILMSHGMIPDYCRTVMIDSEGVIER